MLLTEWLSVTVTVRGLRLCWTNGDLGSLRRSVPNCLFLITFLATYIFMGPSVGPLLVSLPCSNKFLADVNWAFPTRKTVSRNLHLGYLWGHQLWVFLSSFLGVSWTRSWKNNWELLKCLRFWSSEMRSSGLCTALLWIYINIYSYATDVLSKRHYFGVPVHVFLSISLTWAPDFHHFQLLKLNCRALLQKKISLI